MKLLDKETDYYILKETGWDLGFGEIYDKEGNTIGKMDRKIISLRAKITVKDEKDENVITIQKKMASYRKTYDIFDKDNLLIGRTNKKILSLIRPIIKLEDKKGKEIMFAQGSFAGWNFKISHNEEQIAEISKLDKFRDIILKGIFDRTDTYAIHILKKNIDRRLIIGLVIAIDNSVHDK